MAFQPIYHPLPSHEWPEFYLFVTGTRPLSPVEAAATGKKPRMPDALLLSENYLRTPVHGLELMQEKVEDKLAAFTLNGSLAEDITYSDSRVLPSNSQRIQGSSRTTIFDDIMRVAKGYELQVKAPSSYGNDWTANTEECALIDIDYDKLPSFGITEQELVSYLDVPQSSKKNIFDDEMVLVNNKRSALQVYNNIEYLVEQLLKTRCSGDIFCGATVSLCFAESSKIFLCDKNERESSELYKAPEDKVFKDLPLVGEAFFMTQRKKE